MNITKIKQLFNLLPFGFLLIVNITHARGPKENLIFREISNFQTKLNLG
jgi:hypothetical protein